MQIVNVYSTGRTVEFQKYDDKDNQLIISSFTNTEMDPNLDSVELTVYGESGEFLDYNPIITSFKVAQGNVIPTTGFYTKIELDPKTDVNNLGLTRGRINAQYNFLRPLFNSSNIIKYWIREISPSGTELKLSSQNLSNDEIRTGFSEFQNYVSTKNYFVDFYLNFGSNQLVIANNAILLEENGEVYLLVKLYDPLPEEFGLKDTLWLCDKVADSVIYTIDTQIVEDPTTDQNALRGPNNRIKVRERVGQITPYYSYNSLFSSTVSSSLQQLLSYYQDKSIEINVDYSNFTNFIHFSSATERINNFVYKLSLIEQYNEQITETQDFTSMSPSTLTIVSQSNTLAQQNIDNIINKFDTYEYYLYYASESFAWPKSTSTKPYQLYSVTSSEALSWLGDEFTVPNAFTSSILYSASLYDNRNADRLSNAIPQYLLDDANNEPYVTFIDMVGQHFDNVWLYYKDLSNRYSSFNSPNLGLSKDMVADALRGFGFNLYTNTSVSDNLYYTLFGMNQDGSLLPPTGSELITNYVTSSIDTLGPKQLDAEIYKRLYHNLTYLLKTKGTQRGVKALICSYGIPEEILDVNEFGGNNRYTGSGIYEINDQKINYFTQSAELSSPLLSPYVTLQKYNTDNRLNTKDIEVGFSPSDQINTNFVSSSGFVNMDQLIGNPEHQYLSYYPNLETVREDYFATYNYPHSIWEYIRIIKYYNNSLFKTIKDWVPARANASTGIIVKSHILERNKYARTEPSMSFDNNLSESIDMVSIAGGVPGAVQGSTEYLENIYTQYGETQLLYKEDLAKFTGKFSGSSIQATNGQAFEQDDYPDRLLLKRIKSGFAYVWYTSGIMKFFFSGNNSAQNDASSTAAFAYTKTEFLEIGSSIYKDAEFSEVYGPTFPFLLAVYLGVNDALGNEYVVTINPSGIITAVTKTKDATEFFIPFNNVNYGATYQNLLTAKRSKRFFELDYNFNQNVATNFGLVTQSISNSIDNNFDTYNDPYAPYADIQDYNYYTRAFTDNRYFGSKTKSLVYNTYTPPVSGGYEGDSSYGLAAAIDRNSVKLGWVKNFQSSSLNFYDKTSITLKYLVDENQNLLELNQRNENLFEVQNTFKSGENVIVSLSDILKPSFQKTLDGTKKIFRGGFSYDPILFRENLEDLKFKITSGSSTTTEVTLRAYSRGIVETKAKYYYQPAALPGGPSNTNGQPSKSSTQIDAGSGYVTIYVPSDKIDSPISEINQEDHQTRAGIPIATEYNENSWLAKINKDLPVANNTIKNLINTTLSSQRGDNDYKQSLRVYAYNNPYNFDIDSGYSDAINNFQIGLNNLTDGEIFNAPAPGNYKIRLKAPFAHAVQFYNIIDSAEKVLNAGFNNSTEEIWNNNYVSKLKNDGARASSAYALNFNFKVFGILEKLENGQTANDDSNWKIVSIATPQILATEFKNNLSAWNNDYNDFRGYNSEYNNYWIGGNIEDVFRIRRGKSCALAGFVELRDLKNLNNNETDITLAGGDKLRFRFCLVDYNGLIGTPTPQTAIYSTPPNPVFGPWQLLNKTNITSYRYLSNICFGNPSVKSTLLYKNTETFSTEYTQHIGAANSYYNINWWNLSPDISNLPKDAVLQIKNPNATVINSEKSKTIQGEIFKVDQIDKSSITTLGDLSTLIKDVSFFLPQTSSATYKNYSQVIDPIDIQTGDLIRFGAFNDIDSQYYTVLNSETVTGELIDQLGMVIFNADMAKTSMTVSDTNTQLQNSQRHVITVLATPQNLAFFNAVYNNTTGPNPRRFRVTNPVSSYSSTLIPVNSFLLNLSRTEGFEIKELKEQKLLYFPNNSAAVLSSSNPSLFVGYKELNVLRIAISDIFEDVGFNIFNGGYYFSTYVFSYTNNDLGYNNVNFSSWGGKSIFTDSDSQIIKKDQGKLIKMNFESIDPIDITSYYKITLNKEIPNGLNINEDFAILRPKPDETSVIINHVKQDGEVSQTILIPADANQRLKDSIGDIFSSLNTSLSNTNDFTQLL